MNAAIDPILICKCSRANTEATDHNYWTDEITAATTEC